ncbi:hypothetical protein EPA93_12625 [Ktedonosporobacter rubrisoli]|uniref:Lanthionine synthetase n=1 Tax=Ktedonosporobacter rubrisoli TaxID=2509675 RepID=A0A4P6JP07_KTERU|nr:lanthionine synthetase C family protein [Ktedonosporobacter rubrisoli]QBD76802.1 hypothetical protein EPA93_12625 [Ktedonosporobacter rubrisoli]
MHETQDPKPELPDATPVDQLERSAWNTLLPASLRERCLETCQLIAERLRDPAQVQAIADQATRQSTSPFFWGGASFSQGPGSEALLYLFMALCFPDQKWDELAHKYLRLAVQNTHQEPLSYPALYSGSAGLAFLLDLFSTYEPRYQKSSQRTNTMLAEQIMAASWPKVVKEVGAHHYDTISGAAGILGYLISLRSPAPVVEDAIQNLLDYLIWLCGEDEQGCKHWFISPEHFPLESYRDNYPTGYFNLGLSHGIPGPLAALALAWQAGYRLEGQREAMLATSQWIATHQVQDQWGLNWPAGVPLEASSSPERWSRLSPSRTAWCYGTPGIAAALWIAGDALEDEALQQFALTGLEASLRHPLHERRIDSPTICHGVAGLLAVCLRFAQRYPTNSLLQEQISLLASQILDACNPDLPLGVQDEEISGNFVDNPGFLTGAIGVNLTLLAAATAVEPRWDRALLLA